MAENFTAKQKEIVARKLGYDGPMQGFDDFINSSPALGMRYAAITDKFATRMAKGGAVKKYQTGGSVTRMQSDWESWWTNTPVGVVQPSAGGTLVRNADGTATRTEADGKKVTFTKDTDFATLAAQSPAVAQEWNKAYGYGSVGTTTPLSPITNPVLNAPIIGTAPSVVAQQTSTAGLGAQAVLAGPASTATAAPAVVAEGVTAPAPINAPVITAAQSAPSVEQAVKGLTAEQGTLSQQAQMAAVTQDPRTTAVSDLTAAQGQATQVVAPADRTVQAGEMVSGSAVDMGRIDTELAKTQAAQGVVSEEMTVQGQLNKLTKDFDAGNPPPWAAASMRAATAQLAARGLGASSLAGQAIIQATLEAATPIAAADAKVFEQMGLQNLSNRQQIAVLVGQQRAAFLGQEFDQNFQTRVINAAKISDIANKNFDAATTIALENARLTNTMNLANLSARNALILEEAAAMSRLETQSLNNRQQAAVQNAQSFLQIDVKNLDNRQQTAVFKAQAVVNSLVSDAGFENAARATNATNKLEADKISATLALTAQQFTATEKNKVAIANMDAANELAKFNTEERNNREEFNAKMATEINAANARILAEVSVANTAAVNGANAVNAKNATELTASVYAQQSQTYRDLLEMSWKVGENNKDRMSNLAVAMVTKDTAAMKLDSDESKSWGESLVKLGIAIWGK
jgi:hypothetical protein